jgi:prepilin-type N-terminal cleavage/methylation domain-containing protein
MRRKGFTLVEVLVILAILAALAAILVPTVSNQVRKADVGRVTGDLTNLRSGVEAFLVNVHRYPGAINHMTHPITTSQQDVMGSLYPQGLAGRWEGPYIDRLLNDDVLPTGFGGDIQAAFRVDTVALVPYLTIRIKGIAEPEFLLIDAQLDDGHGADAGRLRWFTGDTTAPDSIHFYALPIN